MSSYNDRTPLGHWYSHSYDCIKNGSIDGTDEKPHDKGLVRALKYNCIITQILLILYR